MVTRMAPGSLSRPEVLDAALTIVDRVGLDRLTIRSLARHLGRPPMTLYTHFRSKHELLDLVFARLVEQLFSVRGHPTWDVELAEGCRHAHRLLREHPHWIAILTRVTVPLASLEVYNRILGLMLKDGFRPEAAMYAFSCFVSHALGSVLFERMMGGPLPIPRRRLALVKKVLGTMPPGSYARIASVSPKFESWSFDDLFEVGLRSLVKGLTESAPRRPGYRRRAGVIARG